MTRQVILQAIFSSFQQMTQNVTLPQEYSDSFSQAVALIELQEEELDDVMSILFKHVK